jgi:hypothetical protein
MNQRIKKFWFAGAAVLTAAVFALAGCENPAAPPSWGPNPDTGTDAGTGRVAVSIGIDGIDGLAAGSVLGRSVQGDVMRTVYPALSGFTKYEVRFTPTAGGQAHAPVEVTGSTTGTADLAAGTYTITVTGYTANNTAAAEGTAQGVEITAGGSTAANIILGPKSGAGSGSFSYDITVPAGLATGALVITTQSGEFVNGGTVYLSESGQKTGTLTLPAGSYLAALTLVKGAGGVAEYAGFSHEFVHIYAGLTSVLPAKVYSDDNFGPPAAVDITDLTVLVAMPVKGAAPAAAITATAQYTGTVEWSPEVTGGVFAPSVSYTATVTLAPLPGWTFEGVAENRFTHGGALSATNPANSGIVTIEFPPTADPGSDFSYYNGAISGYAGSATDVVIPATINSQPVTVIGSGAFNQKGLTSVTIPDSVTSIGNYAFQNNQLESVTIPDSVTSIGSTAFLNNQLTSVTIGNSVISIGAQAFRDNQLESVTIGNGVTTIGAAAFQNNQLKSVTIPDSVITIGQSAFQNNQLTSTTIGNKVATIGPNAFQNNQLSSSIDIPNSVTEIGGYAFYQNQLTGVTIGNSVESIGYMAFFENQLESVIIPNSVTSIRDLAFGKNQLIYVTIGNKVASIGYHAFYNNQLTSVTIPGSVTEIGEGAFYNNQLTGVIIPDSVTVLGGSAFFDNKLTSVTISSSVTVLGQSVFAQNQLASVTIPSSVTEIGNGAFRSNQLTSVTIPNSVTEIGDQAFLSNPLTSVTIGANVTLAGINAFNGNLASIYNDGGKLAGTYIASGGWGKQTPEGFVFGNGTIIGYTGSAIVVDIPATINGQPVTAIGNSAFSSNKLTSVTIPNSVIEIGIYAFYQNQLTSVTIGNKVESIGSLAFYQNQLESVIIPDSVTSVGNSAFGNNQLTSVTIGNKVTSIGDSAFRLNQLTDVTIPSSVTFIGNNAFEINKLTSVTIPDSVTSIGNQVFSRNQLTSVTIGNLVTTIGNLAFYDNLLTSVTIPGSVTSIGNQAFTDNQLTSVTIGAGVTLGSNAFDAYLISLYDNESNQAGTYTRTSTSSTVWTKSGGTSATTYTASANGTSNTADSTAITFAFSGTVTGLAASDITVTNGTGSVTKGTLSGSGTSWSLGITVNTAGTVTVAINKTGIESGEKTVTVHKADPGDLSVNVTYGEIPVLKDGAEMAGSFTVGASVTLSVAANAGYSDIKWYVIGQSTPVSTGNAYTLVPAQFSAKKNSVTVTGIKDGTLYSRIVEFEVSK